MWQGAAPLAIQLAHAGGIAHNAALADAAEADNGAHCASVPRDLCIWRHAGTITQNHCSREEKKRANLIYSAQCQITCINNAE